MQDCCRRNKSHKKGLWSGMLFGLVPHTFCIIFLAASIIGAAGATALFKQFLLIPHLFLFLVIISFLFATLTAVIYLKKADCLCFSGIKNKWKYLTTLYAMTIITNAVIIFLIFPFATNIQANYASGEMGPQKTVSVDVAIPCSGHAPLIMAEIKQVFGVNAVKFKIPNTFEITFNPTKTSLDKIAALEIFKTFKLNRVSG